MSINSEYNFACDKCPRTFKLIEFYDKHKKVHELKKQHKCDICGFVYGAAKGLEGHVKTHTDEEIAAAHLNSNRQKLEKLSGGASGIQPFGADFHFLNPQGVLAQAPKLPTSPVKKEEKDIIVDREQLNGKAPSPAGTGNYTIFDTVPQVSDASAAVQNDSGFFMCSICNREFSGLNSLKKHIPIHTRKIQHKCDVCGYVFGKKEYLLDHMRKHTGEVSPICEVCGQTFNKSLKLKEHFKLHRNTGPAGSMSPYKCHICNAVFARPDVLGNHLTVAHAETVYKCDICEATFGDVRGKNHHMYNEHQLDAFHQKCVWCPVCNQGFTRHYNLKVHMYKSHGKEYIENNFSPAELQALMKSAPSPPSVVGANTASSPQPQNNTPHQNTHQKTLSSSSNKKSREPQPLLEFNCKMCGSKFLNKGKLLTHMQSHGVILIPCPTCGDKFMSQMELQAHKAKLHPAKKRRPGPASKTNAPPEKRGANSLPTYLQLSQVSRRSSCASESVNKQLHDDDSAENNQEKSQQQAGAAALSAMIGQLAAAAASKKATNGSLQACNFCTFTCRTPSDLSQHLINECSIIKGLLTPQIKCSRCPNKNFSSKAQLNMHIKTMHRAKEIRRTLGLEEGPPYRRPGPKRARLYKDDTEGTLCTKNVPMLPSNAVLCSSSVLVSKLPRSRVVCLSNTSTTTPSNSVHHSIVQIVPDKFSSSGSSVLSSTISPPNSNSLKNPLISHKNLNPYNNLSEDMQDSNNNNNNNNNNNETNNNNTISEDPNTMLAHANLLLNLSMKPRKKSECPVCGILLSPKTNVNVHLRTHSGVRPYECVLCLNRFRQKAHLMKHFRCTHNQKQPPHICLFCSLETVTSNDLYRHITDAHQKETDELRPSLLAARSDAAEAAAKEKTEAAEMDQHQEQNNLQEEHIDVVEHSDDGQGHMDEDVRYEPIVEDFMFDDMVISPCYIILPYVTEEEIEVAQNPPMEEDDDIAAIEQPSQQDHHYMDEDVPLTIDESITDDEQPDLPKSPIKASDLQEEMQRRQQKLMAYNAEDINGGQPEYYPAMPDFSLPFSMANIWKKKADELNNFNPMEHLALMQKIEAMQKYNGSVVYSGPPSPPSPPMTNGRSHSENNSPKKPKTKPSPGVPATTPTVTQTNTPKEKKFVNNGNVNNTPVADYESQIKNDIWPLDCIKCNSLLGNLDNFNLHMNDHWSDDKCCPVCGLLINSKRFNFKQHLKIHTGEKPFTCNICNRSFRQKAHMVKHVTTHRTLPNGSTPMAIKAE